MHTRIDVLTCPHFWSLLPSTILDWVVIIVTISPSVDAPKRADTSRECNLEYFACHPHRTNLLSVGAHEHYSGCTSLHLQKRIATRATHHPPVCTHHNFGIPGWAQSIENGLIRGKYSTLAETQVCKCVVGQDEVRYALSYQES